MRIYRGTLNWGEFAADEAITIVVPRKFEQGEPICAYWQWTKDSGGNKKVNVEAIGIIDLHQAEKRTIGFHYDRYYKFDAKLSHCLASMTLTMSNPSNDKSTLKPLALSYSDTSNLHFNSSDYLIYAGKMDWYEFAVNEMVIVIVPRSLGYQAQVCAYWQWTKDGGGTLKAEAATQGPLNNAVPNDRGTEIAFFLDQYYRFDGMVSKSKDLMTLTMANPGGDRVQQKPLKLSYPDLSRRKALMARHMTGTDQGFFNVRDLINEQLRFEPYYMNLLYFDSEFSDGTLRAEGQEAPTATRFKRKFIELIENTKPGDVRFVYVDAHGVSVAKVDQNEPGDNVEGWRLAKEDNGKDVEVVLDSWIAKTIQEKLHKDANLTIVCTSCFGSGLLDTNITDRGILLAACYETQFNVKALNGRDPWTAAIISVIKKHKRTKLPIPTYHELFGEARLAMASMMANGELEKMYLGPSPDQRNPIAWVEGQSEMKSHQDPQLIFNSSYLNIGEVAFLEPFKKTIKAIPVEGQPTRLPRDEL